jgi:opacity protein-like surface antigen
VKQGSVFTIGVQPYSRSEFEFNQSKGDSATSYVEILRGTGGLNEIFLAFATTFGAVRAGLAADFYFGRINRVWRVNFTSEALNNTEDITNNHVTGIGLHLGVQTQPGKWMLGAAAGLPSRLSVGTELTTITGFTSDTSESKLKLPFWWGAGVGYAPNRHWLLGVDWRTQRWGTVKPEEFFGERGVDSFDLGFGVEVTPSFDALEGYFKRLSYRFGGAFRQLPYEEPAGKKIHEWTATLGFGLPFSRGYNRIDLALEIGKRGSLSSNVAEENIVMIRAAIVGSERWFQRAGPRR